MSTSIIRKKNEVVVPLMILFDLWGDGNGTKQLGVFLCYPDKISSILFISSYVLHHLLMKSTVLIETIEKALASLNLSWEDVMIIIADSEPLVVKVMY